MAFIIRNSKDRAEVERVRRQSIELAQAGDVDKTDDWEPNSPWQNTRFIHRASKVEWVVYLADHAWPGEVKVLSEAEHVMLP